MKVYVLELGVYDSRVVVGVFRTLEGAMAAGTGDWVELPERCWVNDRDWDAAASILERDLEP